MDDATAPLADGELPSEPPTPPIRIVLHDGQELVGRLLRRWQGNTTAWFYEVSVTLWADAQVGGRDLAEPADIVFNAPASHVRPVDGVSYQGVPIERDRQALIRARTGRRATAPAPAPASTPDAEVTEWWALERFRIAYDSTKPRPVRVHRAGCPLCKASADLTTAQALAALAGPAADACEVCGAAARLQERP
ncbi:DUF6233 domain-containing protein [Streptomyces sp. NPDC050315]|uniref:DUF6233 domain-containing protein n=1 Tax=Streptomyces sp. NPDC050315 TaxID=3155039 RepID=UPI00343FF4A9